MNFGNHAELLKLFVKTKGIKMVTIKPTMSGNLPLFDIEFDAQVLEMHKLKEQLSENSKVYTF